MLEKVPLILVLLNLTVVIVKTRKCSGTVPLSCMNNTNIRISQKMDYYKLKLCLDSQCMTGIEEKWIRCDKVCDACQLESCKGNKNNGKCESEAVTFLESYCATNTPTLSGPTISRCSRETQTVIELPHSTSTTVTVTVSTTLLLRLSNQVVASETSLLILGVMFGLSLFLLAIVTMGWVWTVWILKKTQTEKARNETNGQYTTNSTARETSESQLAVPATVTTTYDVASGQTYSTLNKGQPKGHGMMQDTIGFHDGGNYSYLDIQYKHHLLDKGKKGECGEKHVYDILEKPQGNDNEDPYKGETSDGVMEYEIPVSLKEL